MLRNKVHSRKLTTWRTKVCCSCFPYGSSPWPPIGTFIFTEIPALMLTIELFLSDFLSLGIYLTVLQGLILIFMLKVLTTNPGILPQITYKCQTDQILFDVPSRPPREQHKYLIPQRNMLHPQKYCSECHIYRPIRSIHCSACNHCVQRYDHHCPWLSICIGKYNYKYFLAYLSSLVVLIISSLCVGIYFTIVISRKSDTHVSDFVIYMLVGLVAFIFLLPVGRLLIYHFQLIYKGLTTNEQIKKTFEIINNQLPYQKLQYSIYREKRLPKFSFRQQRLKKQPQSMKQPIDNLELSSIRGLNKSQELQKTDRVGIFNSLIQNQHL